MGRPTGSNASGSNASSSSSINVPVKPVTRRDYDEKRKNNQCFYCNEKYFRGHQCPKRFYMLICPDEPEEEIEAVTGEEEIIPAQIMNDNGEVTLSIHALLGAKSNQTLQLQGQIKKQNVLMLVDSGSTSNFIDLSLAKKIGLKLTPINKVEVAVANGLKVPVQYLCKELLWSVQGTSFVADFLVMPIGGYGVVLRIQWLPTLGDIQCNYSQHTMSFQWQGNRVILQVLNAKNCQDQNDQVQDQWASDQVYFLSSVQSCEQFWSLKMEDTKTQVSDENAMMLTQLLLQFQDVFVEPTTLRPKRACDHGITLKHGSNPVNQRAYKYAVEQKDVIETMAQEMLKSGIIRPSHNNFASPLVLVKKKDGSWRFCIDYRKLNHLTIKDQLPIPIVEELIDELQGSTIFSKLDLRSGYHHIRMKEQDIGKTAFRTHEGLYEFVVIPFGLSNAPATFHFRD